MRTETPDNLNHLWSVAPPPPAGEKTPEWLLDLAAICAGKTLNKDGQFVTATDAFGKIADLRRTPAELDDDAPFVEWGRWFLSDRATRSVAPRLHDHARRSQEARERNGRDAAEPARHPDSPFDQRANVT